MIQEEKEQYNSKDLEASVEEFWQSSDAYHQVRALRKGNKKFYFVDGPPYTTGRIHLGTAWNKIIKDSVLRYRSMNGFDLMDRPGWDMHGLPIEVKVESLLGFKTKKDIEAFGVARFTEECKKFAIGNMHEMTSQFKRLGVWMNWEDPYMTLKNEYIEAAWWAIKQASDKKLLERGLRNVNWCPRCETAIADSEVEYADRTDDSIYVKFPLVDEEGFLVIWTTTPWTLPANMGIAANKQFTYAMVYALPASVLEEASKAAGLDPATLTDHHADGKPKPMRYADKVSKMKEAVGPAKVDELYATKGEKLVMAVDLIEGVMKLGHYADYKVLRTMQGEEMKGLKYKHPLADVLPYQQKVDHKVYLADFVVGENTGLVHIAPGHGFDDFELGQKEGIPAFCPVKPNGEFTDDAGKYAGMNIRDANPKILEDLRERNALLGATEITHRYGHCWRCKTPIIFMTTDQWFIGVSKIKEEMLAEVDRVKWYPSWAGSSRFKDWVSGARDWCISRQRYWGIPIPIWKCERCGSMDVVGTRAELERKCGKSVPDLHRPFVDDVYLECECGGRMKRVPDIFDVWFDSAVASWATVHFPERKDLLEKWWPADFIVEGHDQTRGWFYSQLGAGMVGFGKAPYNAVCMHGFTLDDQGRKMSKSLGNVVAPEEVVEKVGADSLRLYVLYQSAPWDDLSFSWEECGNINRTLNIFWNVYRFPLPYMVLDKFDPSKVTLESLRDHLRVEDRWILSRLQAVIREVDDSMATYELHRATRSLVSYILDDLSRWYVQLVRERTWVEADDPDKLAAYRVLYDVLSTTVKLMAPFTPYMAERMYQNLVRNSEPSSPASVHMCDWPKVNESLLDEQLNKDMDIARKIVESSSNARQKAKRKLRWPVKKIVIAPDGADVVTAVKDLKGVIMEQTNAKDVITLSPGEPNLELGVEVVPNPKVIGPAFKGNAGKVIAALKAADGLKIKTAMEKEGKYALEAGDTVEVTPDMVSFRDVIPESLAMGEFAGGKIYVDVELTPELEAEGYARELIRRIQDMRKDMKLNVEDRIKAEVYVGDDRVRGLVATLRDLITNEVRAAALDLKTEKNVSGALVKDWDVEGVPMTIGIGKV